MNEGLLSGTNKILRRFGYQLTKLRPRDLVRHQPIPDPSASFMLDENHKNLLILELKDTAQSLLSEHLAEFLPKESLLKSEVESFYRVYRQRPLVDNTGGSGFHNSFWLFLFARLMQPNLIVESGVWKGHTTWLLEQACPDARICGFDINLGHLEYKDGKAEFYESDWSQHRFGKVDPEKSLCFFDCHVNHARRIIEAHERGYN